MKENLIADKTFDFAVRIVNLHKYLISSGVDYSLAKQLLRCGTSIGANIAESQYAASLADLTEQEFFSIEKDVDEIISILVAITKTTKEKLNTK